MPRRHLSIVRAGEKSSHFGRIEQATGKAAYMGTVVEEGEDLEDDADTIEAEHTIPAA